MSLHQVVRYTRHYWIRRFELPQLQNLKQLELVFLGASPGESFLSFVWLTKLFPSLSMIQVKFAYTSLDEEQMMIHLQTLAEKDFKAEADYHMNLSKE
ncbi:hypothetical protein ACH5RR_032797 [Cinchona calisaya]|uniref:FBD domain-containing protein n=1 Tax=Cinchona calisaya TaxID=153742 RepID=A0ABD2YNA1_9GENT